MQVTQAMRGPAPHGWKRKTAVWMWPRSCHGPVVALEAMVRDSLAYARAMLALHEVVSGDFRTHARITRPISRGCRSDTSKNSTR